MADSPGRDLHSLDPVLLPRSIAVIGATDNPVRIGGGPSSTVECVEGAIALDTGPVQNAI